MRKVSPFLSLTVFGLLLWSCATADINNVNDSAPNIETGNETIDPAANTSSAENQEVSHAESIQNENTGIENINPDPVTDESVRPESVPLTTPVLISSALNLVPWNMRTVTENRAPLMIEHDLDKNGFNDLLLLAVEGDKDTDASFARLSDSSRLFSSDKDYYGYFLLVFYQIDGTLYLRYTIPVARQQVLNGMSQLEVHIGNDFPYCLDISFRTRAGIVRQLVILNGYGITHFTIEENLSVITLVEDIDKDGYLDIVVHEQGFEEGTGFETFLTWYKWNSREFSEYRNTNIVRNLKTFFDRCSALLWSGDYSGFLDMAVEDEYLDKLRAAGLKDHEILEKIFKPADSEEWGEDNFFDRDGFSGVIFPEIMETPFSYADRGNFNHRVSVRFAADGESRICLANLKMNKNPFQQKQFCFCPGQ